MRVSYALFAPGPEHRGIHPAAKLDSEMNAYASGIRLLRETKDTLVTVNRTVTAIDPLYARIAWAGSAISSLQ